MGGILRGVLGGGGCSLGLREQGLAGIEGVGDWGSGGLGKKGSGGVKRIVSTTLCIFPFVHVRH